MSDYDLAIDLERLTSHAGEVDDCANTLDNCYDTATQTLGQVITNAFGLMFMQYTAVCTYDEEGHDARPRETVRSVPLAALDFLEI